MERRALIISNPGVPGSKTYCEGVIKDVMNYKDFLASPIGGFWDVTSVEHLPCPTEADVKLVLAKMKPVDYSLIIFCGHGYYSSQTESTILELGKGDFNSDLLRGVTRKQTIILDCCRVIAPRITLEDRIYASEITKSERFNGLSCRRYYNDKIEKCDPGILVLNACSIGEKAGDDSEKGGYYSYNLLKSARRWTEETVVDLSKNFKTLSVPETHDLAKGNVTTRSNGTQHPQVEKPRSEPYFPFAIMAG